MKWLAFVLADLSAYTGFPPHVMVMVQLAILMVFASVGFAATFLYFLLWSLALLGAVRLVDHDAGRRGGHQPGLHADQFLDLLRLRALLQLGRRPARAQGLRRQCGARGRAGEDRGIALQRAAAGGGGAASRRRGGGRQLRRPDRRVRRPGRLLDAREAALARAISSSCSTPSSRPPTAAPSGTASRR